MSKTIEFKSGEFLTLVIGEGNCSYVTVVGQSDKALKVCGQNGDARGKTTWIPKSALTPNTAYTIAEFRGFNLAAWFQRKLWEGTSYARVALGLSSY